MIATHFSCLDYAALENLRVLPPLEPKDKAINWSRGSIRDRDFNELLVTGPRLPVLFSGCRFNNIVFNMRGPEDEEAYAFECFLQKVLSRVEAAVSATPDKYKPGVKNVALLQFDRDFIRPSSYSPDLPNEMRVKLAVKRDHVDEHGEIVDLIESAFVDQYNNPVFPEDIMAGSEIIPILRISYYRNGNKFGLNMTLLKGLVYPGEKRPGKSINHAELEFDFRV